MDTYAGSDRRAVVADDHIKLMVAEMINVALKDQRHHLVAYIDKSIAAIETKMAERDASLLERLKKCETQSETFAHSLHRIDSKVEKWVNRGVGVWALAVTVFALVQFGTKFVGK